jgi:hypothetical protein
MGGVSATVDDMSGNLPSPVFPTGRLATAKAREFATFVEAALAS